MIEPVAALAVTSHPSDRADPPAEPDRERITLADALAPTPRTIQERLERLLLDDHELLISLQCQLEQIRREMRLLNDERIVRAIGPDRDSSLRH